MNTKEFWKDIEDNFQEVDFYMHDYQTVTYKNKRFDIRITDDYRYFEVGPDTSKGYWVFVWDDDEEDDYKYLLRIKYNAYASERVIDFIKDYVDR